MADSDWGSGVSRLSPFPLKLRIGSRTASVGYASAGGKRIVALRWIERVKRFGSEARTYGRCYLLWNGLLSISRH